MDVIRLSRYQIVAFHLGIAVDPRSYHQGPNLELIPASPLYVTVAGGEGFTRREGRDGRRCRDSEAVAGQPDIVILEFQRPGSSESPLDSSPRRARQRSDAKNPVQAVCKPLARYGAMEGALARGLLHIGEGSNPHVAAGSIPDVA
jgi:hypothetical protein